MDNKISAEEDQARNCGCKLCKENLDFQEKLGKFTSSITGTVFDINVEDMGNLPPCKIDCVIYTEVGLKTRK